MTAPSPVADSHNIAGRASALSATRHAKTPKRQPAGLPESWKGMQ